MNHVTHTHATVTHVIESCDVCMKHVELESVVSRVNASFHKGEWEGGWVRGGRVGRKVGERRDMPLSYFPIMPLSFLTATTFLARVSLPPSTPLLPVPLHVTPSLPRHAYSSYPPTF